LYPQASANLGRSAKIRQSCNKRPSGPFNSPDDLLATKVKPMQYTNRRRLLSSCRTVLAIAIVVASAGAPLLAQAPAPAGGSERASGRQPGGDRGGRGGMGGFGGVGGMFGGGGDRGFEPSVTSDEVTRYAKMLELSPDQSQAMTALHEAFLQSFSERAKVVQEKSNEIREQIRETRDMSLWSRLGEEMQKWRTERASLESGFMGDVQAILTPEQSNKFAQVEQTRRRERSLSRAMMSGTNVDLVRIVSDMKLAPDDATKVQPLLEQYASELDRQLIEFNKQRDDLETKFRSMMQSQDTEGMAKAFDEGRTSATKIRDINQRFGKQIQANLPEAAQQPFSEQVNRAAFPQVYRPTYAGRMADYVSKLPDLTPEQTTAINSLTQTYRRDLGALNKQLETALSARESSVTGTEIFAGRGGGGGGWMGMMGAFDSDEIRALRERRRDLDDNTVERLTATLTEAQREGLPSREELRNRDNAPGGDAQGDSATPREQRPRRRAGGNRTD
jgi:Spy/CpxP family protein refolding chaperone